MKQNVKMNTVKFKIVHGKPFFPANENAEKYIEETLSSTLRQLPEFELLSMKYIKSDMMVEVKFDFIARESDRVSVVQNRINKVGKNICKKFKTTFSPVRITEQ